MIVNFTGFIELGLGEAETGATNASVIAFSQRFHDYVSHLEVALAGFIAAVGVALIFFAMWGIQRGQRWAFWRRGRDDPGHDRHRATAALPVRPGDPGHLGLIYLDGLVFAVGVVLGLRAFRGGSGM